MTHEDCLSRLLARKRRADDVVHRQATLTLSSGRDRQPFGRILEAFEQRRDFGTMNHIAPSATPCRKPPKYVLMGHSHRDLVLITQSYRDQYPH